MNYVIPQLRVGVLLLYYNRPKMVVDAICSYINTLKIFDNSHLYILDDSSDVHINDVLDSMKLTSEQQHITAFRVDKEIKEDFLVNDEKYTQGVYSNLLMNQMTKEGCQVMMVLCDDDMLFEHSTLMASYTLACNYENTYAFGLSFSVDEEELSKEVGADTKFGDLINEEFAHVPLAIPTIFKYEPNRPLWVRPIEVYNDHNNKKRLETASKEELNTLQPVIDISQLIFRCDKVVENKILWEDRQNAYLDFEFVGKLYRQFGMPLYIPTWLQYKRLHEKQLGKLTPEDKIEERE